MVRRTPPRRAPLVAAFLVTFLLLPNTVARAVPLFSDGFESGDLSNWTSSRAFTVQNQIALAGSWSGRATSVGADAYAYRQLASAQSNVYFKSAFNLLSANGTTTLLRLRSASGSAILSLNVKVAGTLVVKNHVTGATRTSSTTVSTNVPHEAQLHGRVNGASSVVEVWLDGVPVADISGTDNLGTTPIGRVQLGQNSGTVSYDVVFDEVVADTQFIGASAPPPTPTNLRTTKVTANQVDLAWNPAPGATSYRIYRDVGQIGTSNTTSFQDTNVDPETQYAYSADACNSLGCSAPTAPILVTTPPEGTGDGTIVMAAGDIACDPADAGFNNGNGTTGRCRQMHTAALLSPADAVFALGDTQYECGGTAAYAQSYHPSWGQFKSITFPIVADQEYATSGTDCGAPGADGYFGYFGAAAHPESDGYYSFDLGGWHVVALNSECSDIDKGNASDGCADGSPQNDWLEADLAANTETCTIALLHKPLFFSKKTGSQTNTKMRPLWDDLYAAGADIVLSGNSHFYERFEPQTPTGQPDPGGIVEWILGTGGKSLGNPAAPADRFPTSETAAKTYGVLSLTLHATSYDWEFVVEGGSSFTDTGTASCV
jgi:fibronectin type III domain protein